MFNEASKNPNSDVWRLLRKKIRTFAKFYKEISCLQSEIDYVPIIANEMIAFSGKEASNFMTWGIVMFEPQMNFRKDEQDRFINLLGIAQETGNTELFFPLISCIQENFLHKSMDFLAFTHPEGEDFYVDFFRLYKAKYMIETFQPVVMDWLFSQMGLENDLKYFAVILNSVFIISISKPLERIVEIMEDLGGIKIDGTEIPDLIELSEIFLLEYWNSIAIDEQIVLLNEWPDSTFMYNFSSVIPQLFDQELTSQHLENLLKIMQRYGYHQENLAFLKESPKEYKYLKKKIKIFGTPNENFEAFARLNLVQVIHFGDLAHAERMINYIFNNPISGENLKILNYYAANLNFYQEKWSSAEIFCRKIGETDQELGLKQRGMAALCLLLDGKSEEFYAEFEDIVHNHSIHENATPPYIRDLYWDLIAMKGISYMFQLTDTLIERENIDGPKLCNDMGQMTADLGFFDEAIKLYNRGFEFEISDTFRGELYNNIGSVLTQQGKLDEAIKKFQQAVALNPNSARIWLNMAKSYGFKGEPMKALECVKHTQENLNSDSSSPAEFIWSNYESNRIGFLASTIINYNAIKFSDIEKQFRLADRLFFKSFPQDPDLQELATSIFMHYGNGIELLFHYKLGAIFTDRIKELHGEDLIKLQKYELKKKIPKKLHNLLYGSHIGHSKWGKIIETILNPPKTGKFKHYTSCLVIFKEDELKLLKNTVEFTGKLRNLSDHGEILNYDVVKHYRSQLVYLINSSLEIFR
jgi:tetratricopeptide (TPR) repeat protein